MTIQKNYLTITYLVFGKYLHLIEIQKCADKFYWDLFIFI